ncbi:hypothetical protein BGX26_005690, partial [Mortierella sp. AD094]
MDTMEITVDHVGGQNIIYWEDIEQVFPGVKHVLNGKVAIKLLRGLDGVRIMPHCIKHFPDVVLDVVLFTPVEYIHVDSPIATTSLALADALTEVPTKPYRPGAILDLLNPPSSSSTKGSEMNSIMKSAESVPAYSNPFFVSQSDFNILVLGERQSGKSTLIEAIENYARQDILHPKIPRYTPTRDVKSTPITTTLPRFSIFESADDQDEGSLPNQLNNDDIRQYLSLVDEEYEQQKPYLHIQKDQQTHNPYNFNFRLIDAPGLDFIKDGSKSHIAERESGVFMSKTLPAIIKQLGPTCAVHLVLLVIPDTDNYDNSDA